MDYPAYEFLVELHTHLMRDRWHETYYGPTRPELLKSALFRPRHAAWYEKADGIRQAALASIIHVGCAEVAEPFGVPSQAYSVPNHTAS